MPSGTYPTIESALDDLGCPFIIVASGDYHESLLIDRSVVITGPNDYSVRILGEMNIDIDSSSEEVSLEYLVIAAAEPNQPLFSDGFETGDTSQWSSSTP